MYRPLITRFNRPLNLSINRAIALKVLLLLIKFYDNLDKNILLSFNTKGDNYGTNKN